MGLKGIEIEEIIPLNLLNFLCKKLIFKRYDYALGLLAHRYVLKLMAKLKMAESYTG